MGGGYIHIQQGKTRGGELAAKFRLEKVKGLMATGASFGAVAKARQSFVARA